MMLVETLWADLLQQRDRPIYRRVDAVHPLDLYAGLDAEDERLLMLICDEEPKESPAYDALDVHHGRRHDGRWALVIRLLKQDLAAPFGRLCQDLIDGTRYDSPETAGPDFLLRRLARWRKLMELMHGGFSDVAARGLIGELSFLEATAIPRFGVEAAVRGWVGPEGSPQDFRVAGYVVEVKTCALGSDTVTIASLDQLDAGTAPLYLVIVRLSPSSRQSPGAFTLTDLVERVRSVVGDVPARSEFEMRLANTGFDEQNTSANVYYELHENRAFAVSAMFPRLTRSTVPAGIREASYLIELSVCSRFECGLDFGHGDQ